MNYIIDQTKKPIHDIRLMMERQYSDIKNETIVSSIANKDQMERIFASLKLEYFFHATVYKHVPMMG